MRIGIIGMGTVGTAVAKGSHGCKLSTFDKYVGEKTQNLDGFKHAELCFVCVPTPTRDNKQDLVEVLSSLDFLNRMPYRGVVAIKSTVLPGTCRGLKMMFPELRIVHNPEFLSTKTAVRDYYEQEVALVSGKIEDTSVVSAYLDRCLDVKTLFLSPEYEATEFAKYIHNCALAVKLSFLNEVFEICKNAELFNLAIKMAKPFGNLGTNNLVPGPDGVFGWAGTSLVKDTKAFSNYAQQRRVLATTLTGAIVTNARIRPDAYDGTEKTGVS